MGVWVSPRDKKTCFRPDATGCFDVSWSTEIPQLYPFTEENLPPHCVQAVERGHIAPTTAIRLYEQTILSLQNPGQIPFSPHAAQQAQAHMNQQQAQQRNAASEHQLAQRRAGKPADRTELAPPDSRPESMTLTVSPISTSLLIVLLPNCCIDALLGMLEDLGIPCNPADPFRGVIHCAPVSAMFPGSVMVFPIQWSNLLVIGTPQKEDLMVQV